MPDFQKRFALHTIPAYLTNHSATDFSFFFRFKNIQEITPAGVSICQNRRDCLKSNTGVLAGKAVTHEIQLLFSSCLPVSPAIYFRSQDSLRIHPTTHRTIYRSVPARSPACKSWCAWHCPVCSPASYCNSFRPIPGSGR